LFLDRGSSGEGVEHHQVDVEHSLAEGGRREVALLISRRLNNQVGSRHSERDLYTKKRTLGFSGWLMACVVDICLNFIARWRALGPVYWVWRLASRVQGLGYRAHTRVVSHLLLCLQLVERLEESLEQVEGRTGALDAVHEISGRVDHEEIQGEIERRRTRRRRSTVKRSHRCSECPKQTP
jgi:hypothetical protein